MDKTGVLVISHGSSNGQWNRYIEEAVAQAKLPLPRAVAFLEWVPNKSIADGVAELEKQGVKQILVIPLFVCLGSTHLEEIKYALGIISHSAVPTDIEKISSQAEIIWGPAFDSHPYMTDIICDRIHKLSNDPSKESLLLVAHGSEIPGFYELWEKMLYRLSHRVQKRINFLQVSYATLRPDNLLARLEKIKGDRMIVVPVFLSIGYFTKHVIPAKLKSYSCVYSGETLLPHPLISKWIEETVNSC
ncbi:cobalamin biosynthesis protein CbiX [Microaerobacter geothermalis]|uniref:sirohydrochlorin chelatase n=1 Tax=Microaerobacter geothermalis TaxID=674972 RepID=UPI001F3AEE87|nr:CbiX/SirB N-terminal domain-containing protein [Microaerobacter geothermalis]MCF6092674.1 cobalamin biosynthesis protein CbiX [Microaerobacter geothermalis]